MVFPATHSQTIPAFTPQPQSITAPLAGSYCAYPRRDGQAELTWVAGYIPRYIFPYRELNPGPVTHSSTNWARCSITSLIQTVTTKRNRQQKCIKFVQHYVEESEHLAEYCYNRVTIALGSSQEVFSLSA